MIGPASSEAKQPSESPTPGPNVSGGVNVAADRVDIAGDVVGRDKIVADGDVIGRDKITNTTIINVIRSPGLWQKAIWDFLSRYLRFIIFALIVESVLLAIYVRFKNLYLISWWYWALAAILLGVVLWGGYARWRLKYTKTRITILAALSFACVIAWQAWQILYPPRFDPQVFGIALAELGEGADFELTATSKEISDQVYELLCQTMKPDSTITSTEEPCSGTGQWPGRLVVRRVGVINDSETARAYGKQIGAEIVIWGQILTSDPGGITVRFQALQTLDQAVNPDFPVVLPVTTSSTDIYASFHELNLKNDLVETKRIIAEQSTALSSFMLGLIAYLDQDFSLAIRQLEPAVRIIQGEPSLGVSKEGLSLIYYYLGTANQILGGVNEGQEWLLKAQKLNPNEPAISLSLAFGYNSFGQEQERDANLGLALESIEKWLAIHSGDNAAIYDRGIVNFLRNQPEFELLDYQAIIERDPNFYIAYINLGRTYAKLERFSDAEETLRQAIDVAERSGANSSVAYLELAKVRARANQPEAAKEAYLKAIEGAPKPALTKFYYYYAMFLEATQEVDGALLAYDKMIEVANDKNRGWAYEYKAHLLRRLGLLEAAAESFRQAIHEHDQDPLLHTYLAETYSELGAVDNARREFEQAVALDGSLYYVYSSYAWFLYQEGEYQQAAKFYEKSLELRPGAEVELQSLAVTYTVLGRCQKARETYSEILRLSDHVSKDAVRIAQEGLTNLSSCVESP